MAKSIDEISAYEDRCSIMHLILEVIEDISDPDYQRKAWIECSIPNVVDSWEETICGFFDDANIDGFLKDMTPESDPEFGLSSHQIEELWKLRNILDAYCDVTPKYMNPRDVLSDPRWHKVVECAKETLKAFEGYKVPTDDMLKF